MLRQQQRKRLRWKTAHRFRQIQIVSGLSYDDEVITSWSKELYDGAAVNIQGSDDSAETTADSSETTAEETTEAAETAAK